MKSIISQSIAFELIKAATNIGISVTTARLFLPEGKADYALFVLAAGLLIIIVGMGLPSSITYFRSKGMMSMNQVLFATCIQITALLVIIYALHELTNTKDLGGFLPQGQNYAFLILLIFYCIISIINQNIQSLINSIQKFSFYNYLTSISVFILFLISIYMITLGYEGGAAVILYISLSVFFTALLLLVSIAYTFYHLRTIKGLYKKVSIIKVVAYGLKSTASDFIQLLAYRVDIWIVLFFLNRNLLGQYVLAVGLAQFLWLIPNTIGRIALPTVARGTADLVNISQLARMSFAVVTTISIAAACLVHTIIPFAFGKQFEHTATLFILLLPGVVLFTLCKIYASYLAARGDLQTNILASITGLAIGVAFNFILIPPFGIFGAAIGTTMGYMATTGIVLLKIHRSELTIFELVVPKIADFRIWMNNV